MSVVCWKKWALIGIKKTIFSFMSHLLRSVFVVCCFRMLTRFLKSAVISRVNTARFRKPVEISLLSCVRWLFPRFSRTSVYCSLLSTWSGNTISHNQKQDNPVTFLQITGETRNQHKTVFGANFSSVIIHFPRETGYSIKTNVGLDLILSIRNWQDCEKPLWNTVRVCTAFAQ